MLRGPAKCRPLDQCGNCEQRVCTMHVCVQEYQFPNGSISRTRCVPDACNPDSAPVEIAGERSSRRLTDATDRSSRHNTDGYNPDDDDSAPWPAAHTWDSNATGVHEQLDTTGPERSWTGGYEPAGCPVLTARRARRDRSVGGRAKNNRKWIPSRALRRRRACGSRGAEPRRRRGPLLWLGLALHSKYIPEGLGAAAAGRCQCPYCVVHACRTTDSGVLCTCFRELLQPRLATILPSTDRYLT